MRASAWIKSIVGGGIIIIGGPMLIRYVQPTDEELFKRYNPDLQRRSLEGREQKLQEANDFINQLKEYSKSDKPIWTVWKEDALRKQAIVDAEAKKKQLEKKSIAEEIKRQRLQQDDPKKLENELQRAQNESAGTPYHYSIQTAA